VYVQVHVIKDKMLEDAKAFVIVNHSEIEEIKEYVTNKLIKILTSDD